MSPLLLCSVRRGRRSPSEQPPRKESSRRRCSSGLDRGSAYGLARRASCDQNRSIWPWQFALFRRSLQKISMGKERQDMSPSKAGLNVKARGSHSPLVQNTPLEYETLAAAKIPSVALRSIAASCLVRQSFRCQEVVWQWGSELLMGRSKRHFFPVMSHNPTRAVQEAKETFGRVQVSSTSPVRAGRPFLLMSCLQSQDTNSSSS
jgi:hypothetical protein